MVLFLMLVPNCEYIEIKFFLWVDCIYYDITKVTCFLWIDLDFL